jgi:drug/metabolite transporter (DMT)-like permease
MPHLWFFAALAAAALWGFSYAATGRILESGVPISIWLLSYAGAASVIYLFVAMREGAFKNARGIFSGNANLCLLVGSSVLAAVLANFLIAYSISQKNATIASLIEISYPFFTLFFAWLMFREVHLTMSTAAGAALVFAGIALIYLKG